MVCRGRARWDKLSWAGERGELEGNLLGGGRERVSKGRRGRREEGGREGREGRERMERMEGMEGMLRGGIKLSEQPVSQSVSQSSQSGK